MNKTKEHVIEVPTLKKNKNLKDCFSQSTKEGWLLKISTLSRWNENVACTLKLNSKPLLAEYIALILAYREM